MSNIFISYPRSGISREIDFATLISIIKGSSIVSLADSDQYIEFGLSENLLVRIEGIQGKLLSVSVVSTLNDDQIPPARIQIVAEGEEPTAGLVERRLHSLRQVYAIAFLLDAGREQELATVLRENQNFDLEELLRPDERLYLQAAGPGSWWLTVLTKAKGAGQRALNTLSFVYSEGRELLLRRVRTQTEFIELKTEEMRIKVEKQRGEAFIDLVNKAEKIKDPALRGSVKERLISEASVVDPNIRGLLPPPKK
jgi:hypothetical protein